MRNLKPNERYLINELLHELEPRHMDHFLSLGVPERLEMAIRVWVERYHILELTGRRYDNADQAYYYILHYGSDIQLPPAGYVRHQLNQMRGESA